MVFAVPRLCVFQSKTYKSQYLQYVPEMKGPIMCYGEQVVSPYSKFCVQKSTNKSDKTLVHIRCCFNNKYWVLQSENNDLIVAAAGAPEEQSRWNSTLFKPIFVHDYDQTLRFLHVQSGRYLNLADYDGSSGCLRASGHNPNDDLSDVFTVINWESLTILPKFVSFKAENGKYLMADGDRNIIVCDADQIGTNTVMNEVATNSDGSICLKNISGTSSSYWLYHEYSDGTISVASSNSSRGTKFWPVKVDNNVICLRCMEDWDKKYLKRSSNNLMLVEELTVSCKAQLQVEEPILSRRIENISYRLEEARTYNESVVMMVHSGATNNSEVDNEYQLAFTYTYSQTSTWNASVSLSLGFEIEFEAGIPLIYEDKIKISGEFKGKYDWGSTTSKSEQKTQTHTVIVPKMKKKTVTMIVSQATCDVPYSYVQHDTLLNGISHSYPKYDGVFKGVNTSKIQYKIVEEPI